MIRLLRRILLVVAVLLFVPFAVANRHPVKVGYWPFETTVEAPLFLFLLAFCALGVLLLVGARVLAFLSDSANRILTRSKPDTSTSDQELE